MYSVCLALFFFVFYNALKPKTYLKKLNINVHTILLKNIFQAIIIDKKV